MTAAPQCTPILVGGMFPARRWHDFPHLVQPDDAAERRACTICGEPTVWKRPRKRGAATHPTCETRNPAVPYGPYDVASDELYICVAFTLATTLGATVHTVVEPAEKEPRKIRLGNPQAGCELCGRSHAALWIAARTWRCAEHPPSNDTYRRRR